MRNDNFKQLPSLCDAILPALLKLPKYFPPFAAVRTHAKKPHISPSKDLCATISKVPIPRNVQGPWATQSLHSLYLIAFCTVETVSESKKTMRWEIRMILPLGISGLESWLCSVFTLTIHCICHRMHSDHQGNLEREQQGVSQSKRFLYSFAICRYGGMMVQGPC